MKSSTGFRLCFFFFIGGYISVRISKTYSTYDSWFDELCVVQDKKQKKEKGKSYTDLKVPLVATNGHIPLLCTY